MAGTVTETVQNINNPPVDVISLAWVSDASGDVSGTNTAKNYSGTVSRVHFIPSATAAPTANYDVTILDDDGVDVIDAQGADRSATLKEAITGFGEVMGSELQLVVANAGNAKEGIVVIHIRRDI